MLWVINLKSATTWYFILDNVSMILHIGIEIMILLMILSSVRVVSNIF
jgi:hypothetical protein